MVAGVFRRPWCCQPVGKPATTIATAERLEGVRERHAGLAGLLDAPGLLRRRHLPRVVSSPKCARSSWKVVSMFQHDV